MSELLNSVSPEQRPYIMGFIVLVILVSILGAILRLQNYKQGINAYGMILDKKKFHENVRQKIDPATVKKMVLNSRIGAGALVFFGYIVGDIVFYIAAIDCFLVGLFIQQNIIPPEKAATYNQLEFFRKALIAMFVIVGVIFWFMEYTSGASFFPSFIRESTSPFLTFMLLLMMPILAVNAFVARRRVAKKS